LDETLFHLQRKQLVQGRFFTSVYQITATGLPNNQIFVYIYFSLSNLEPVAWIIAMRC